jgi:hypothetical protein
MNSLGLDHVAFASGYAPLGKGTSLAKPEANLKTIQVLSEVLLSMPELLHEKIYIKIYI